MQTLNSSLVQVATRPVESLSHSSNSLLLANTPLEENINVVTEMDKLKTEIAQIAHLSIIVHFSR